MLISTSIPRIHFNMMLEIIMIHAGYVSETLESILLDEVPEVAGGVPWMLQQGLPRLKTGGLCDDHKSCRSVYRYIADTARGTAAGLNNSCSGNPYLKWTYEIPGQVSKLTRQNIPNILS